MPTFLDKRLRNTLPLNSELESIINEICLLPNVRANSVCLSLEFRPSLLGYRTWAVPGSQTMKSEQFLKALCWGSLNICACPSYKKVEG